MRRSFMGGFRSPVDIWRKREGLSLLRMMSTAKSHTHERATWMQSLGREHRRMLARANRRHGRGYTKPAHGRAHTRGSGRS